MYQRFEAVTLEITKKCNHECTFCYNLANANSSDVTFEQIDIVVNKLHKYGIERVTVTGGEPYMVREKVEYLIKKLLENNFDVCSIRTGQGFRLRLHINQEHHARHLRNL